MSRAERDYAYWQPRVKGKLGALLKVIKLQHAPLVEGPALLGAFALYHFHVPSIATLVLIVVASFSVHVFGETYNEMVGIRWHANDPVKRPFVAGTLSLKEGWCMVVLGILGLFCSAYLLNGWAFLLSPVVVGITLVYPHLKDRLAAAVYVLGLIVSVDVIGGYVAAVGSLYSNLSSLLASAPWLMAISALLYTAAFDEVANQQHLEIHRKVGIAEFSAVKSSRFTQNFVLINFLVATFLASAGCFYYFLGPVALFSAVVFGLLSLKSYDFMRKGKIGKSMDFGMLSWLVLVIGVVISRLV